RYEAWYASLLHMCFRAIGVDVRAEEATSHGQADMVVRTGGQAFILEFKMAETDADIETKLAEAFTQMREKGYANRYRDRQEPIHLVAVVCGREARNLLEVRVEPAGNP
ncbi:MAG: PD-(D/E)XK nuclease domain-containing protein, partial [Rhodobacteraceae bacterium]|nr:PD-(D/E)XK nuclease domain-containing protein [Paracoccaceae bacterium]